MKAIFDDRANKSELSSTLSKKQYRSDLKPIKIIHLITELNMGGAEQMLLKLVMHMDREQFEPMVISMTDIGPVGIKLIEQGIQVHALGMEPGKPSFIGLAILIRLLKANSPDLIQTWLYHADLLGLIAGKMAGIKRIVWGLRCSNMEFKNYRLLTRITVRLCRWLSIFVDAIIVNSIEGQHFHVRLGYQKKKMIYIPNGFDLEHFKPDEEARDWLRHELSLPRESVLVGLIARFDPMKDQANFLKAASLLPPSGENIFFIMVGKEIDNNNKQLLAMMPDKIKDHVRLLGIRHDIPRVTAGLDIAISASAYGEGFSNIIGEAMACGVPCVVTDVGASASILGSCGMVVPPKDPEALAIGIQNLLALGKGEMINIGKQARIRVMQQYELNQIVSRFESVYHQITVG
jgi:glycosyltransferase involved in cell wall biosynthesis